MGQNDYFISEMKLKWNVSEDHFAEGSSTLLKLYNVSSSLTVHAYKPFLSVRGLVPNHLWPTENWIQFYILTSSKQVQSGFARLPNANHKCHKPSSYYYTQPHADLLSARIWDVTSLNDCSSRIKDLRWFYTQKMGTSVPAGFPIDSTNSICHNYSVSDIISDVFIMSVIWIHK